jgi:antitoxin (DNA-binding transcriptional repressor) of toxin-antitoxin stability system
MLWKTGLTRKFIHFREQLRNFAEQWAALDFVALRQCALKTLSAKKLTCVTFVYIIMAQMEEMKMKFLSVRDLRGKSAEVWKELPEEREMIITSNGRPIAILAAISESNLEESLAAFRQARAVEAVASLQRRSADKGTDKITMDEIDEEIKAVRKKRATAR